MVRPPRRVLNPSVTAEQAQFSLRLRSMLYVAIYHRDGGTGVMMHTASLFSTPVVSTAEGFNKAGATSSCDSSSNPRVALEVRHECTVGVEI